MLNAAQPRVFLDENETDSLSSRRLAGKQTGSTRTGLKALSGNVVRERGKHGGSSAKPSDAKPWHRLTTKSTATVRPRRALANITNAASKLTRGADDATAPKPIELAAARPVASPQQAPAQPAPQADTWDEPERLAGPSGAELEAAARAEDVAQAQAEGKRLADLFEMRRRDADTASELSYDHVAPSLQQDTGPVADASAEDDAAAAVAAAWPEMPDLSGWACFDVFNDAD